MPVYLEIIPSKRARDATLFPSYSPRRLVWKTEYPRKFKWNKRSISNSMAKSSTRFNLFSTITYPCLCKKPDKTSSSLPVICPFGIKSTPLPEEDQGAFTTISLFSDNNRISANVLHSQGITSSPIPGIARIISVKQAAATRRLYKPLRSSLHVAITLSLNCSLQRLFKSFNKLWTRGLHPQGFISLKESNWAFSQIIGWQSNPKTSLLPFIKFKSGILATNT